MEEGEQLLTGPSSHAHRTVWRIAGPMILSNISVPLLGMVDTAVMGHLPSPVFLGAVAVGATIFSFLFMGLNFLRMGTTGLTAQIHGRGDSDAMRTALAQALITAGGLALLLLLFQAPLARIAVLLVGPSPEVAELAAEYFGVRIWSAPFVLANFALIGWFLGMQDARAPLAMMLGTNLVNIVLDLVFVLGLGMDVTGVALASVLAEGFGLVLGLMLARRILGHWPGRWRWERIRHLEDLKRLFGVNANLFIRTLSLMFAFAFLTAQGARLGDVILAANAVLLNFLNFMSYGLDGLAHAAEALIGRAIGARDRRGLDAAYRIGLAWSVAFAGGFALLVLALGPALVALLTDIQEVRDAAGRYLPWLAAAPVVAVWCYFYDGAFVGATRAREMRDTMLVSVLLVYIPSWYLLRPFENHGLWAAFLLFLAARGLTLHLAWRRSPPVSGESA